MGRASLSSPRLPVAMLVLLPALLLMTPGVSSLGKELFACDFENDLCGLIQDTDDNFDWTRHQGSTDTPGTGPHEAYSGTYYIYVQFNQHNHHMASLRTPALGYQGQACVTVAYHMYGRGNGLEMLTSPDNHFLWSKYGDQGDRWLVRTQLVNLHDGNGIKLLGNVPLRNTSVIAVDDLVITEGSCKEEVSLPYHCSFESGLCGMTQSYDDDFDWTRNDRSSGSSKSGPSQASDGQWFIFINTNLWANLSSRDIIETPTFNHTGTLCLRFDYRMYGFSLGSLRVFHETSGSLPSVSQQWKDKGNTWHSEAVDITGFQPGEWIAFRAWPKSGYGYIAVDNINIATGGCIIDIDECSEKTSGCSQHCNNTDGGFTCYCDDGFRLGKDNSTCQDGSSLWQIPVGVGLGLAVIVAVVVLVVVIIRRRWMTSLNDDPTVTYENDNVRISSDVTAA